MRTYLICGYGIPKDIRTDVHYQTYLHPAFNRIFSESAGSAALVIPCGGPTNCTAPYEGTEADMIAEYMREWIERSGITDRAAAWQIVPENRSLSTLENLLFAKEIMDKQGVEGDSTVFCEYTREMRVQKTAAAIFGDRPVRVIAIDFNVSSVRYFDPAIIIRKEAETLAEAMWTLESPDRIALHHEFFTRKFAFLRKRQTEGLTHVQAVEEWYKLGPDVLKELMPEHPLFLKNV